MLAGEALHLVQRLLPGFGQVQFVVAAIADATPPLNQPLLSQLINEQDHAAGENAEPFRELLLTAFWNGRNHPQDARVRRSDAKRCDAFPETSRGMRAQLREQEGGAGGTIWLG